MNCSGNEKFSIPLFFRFSFASAILQQKKKKIEKMNFHQFFSPVLAETDFVSERFIAQLASERPFPIVRSSRVHL